MPKYKTCFQEEWLEEEAFKDEKDKNSAFCKVSCKSFNTGTGGNDSV